MKSIPFLLIAVGSHFTGAATLYYSDWARAKILPELMEAAGAPEQDADGDGIANAMEFLWGLDPMIPDDEDYPSVQILADPARLAFHMPVTVEGRAGIFLAVQSSPDLATWTPADFDEPVPVDSRVIEVPIVAGQSRFYLPFLDISTLDNPDGPPLFRLEAEEVAASSSGVVESEWAGFSGSGYLNTTNATGEWIEFPVSVALEGTFRIDIGYALGGTSVRPHVIGVNGIEVADFNPEPTTWDDWRVHSLMVSLREGPNTLRLTGTGSGGVANIDYLDVHAVPGDVYYQLQATAVGPGTVEVQPAAEDHLFKAGTLVSLTAVPDEGAVFSGWSGDVESGEPFIQVVMEGDVSLQALFSTDIGGYEPDFSLQGWATQAGGTTGGEGGQTVVVTTYPDLVAALGRDEPLVILVSGTITGVGDAIRVHSDKSILGIGHDAGFAHLGLQVGWNSAFGQVGNVIIRNLYFGEVAAPTDKVAVSYGGHHVWIDHCVFESPPTSNVDTYDGQVDITHAGDYVTVSWCRFIQHNKNILIGHSEGNGDEDTGHLRATFHHNEFRNTKSRNPSVRFGTVHVFNNYYNHVTDYGIASRLEAQVVVENNYFLNVLQPMNADTGLSDIPGHIRGEETNIYIGCGPNSIISTPATWIPPYPYSLDEAASIPAVVDQYAGTGIVTFGD